jgi:hypothetical protein
MRLGSVRMLVQALSWRREFKTAGERERERERENLSEVKANVKGLGGNTVVGQPLQDLSWQAFSAGPSGGHGGVTPNPRLC